MAWRRPSDGNQNYTITDGVSTISILYESDFESKGISLALKHKDPARAGLNGSVGMRLGFNNRIRAAIERPLQ